MGLKNVIVIFAVMVVCHLSILYSLLHVHICGIFRAGYVSGWNITQLLNLALVLQKRKQLNLCAHFYSNSLQHCETPSARSTVRFSYQHIIERGSPSGWKVKWKSQFWGERDGARGNFGVSASV